MTDHPDPVRIRACLDDLARLAVRHGLRVRRHGGGEATLTIETLGDVRGLDPTRMFTHERLALKGSGSVLQME